jgi:crossover junction endodeoxyribonuclease RuvC
MRILGIDPGTGRVGWAVMELDKGKERLIECGCFETKANSALTGRLVLVYDFILELIEKFKPDEAAVEDLFFATNAKTAISVGMSRGVIVLALTQKGVPSFDYAPLKVKMAVVGYGKADKKQVQFMVKQILKLPEIPQPDDAADAVALALTHSANRRMKMLS